MSHLKTIDHHGSWNYSRESEGGRCYWMLDNGSSKITFQRLPNESQIIQAINEWKQTEPIILAYPRNKKELIDCSPKLPYYNWWINRDK